MDSMFVMPRLLAALVVIAPLTGYGQSEAVGRWWELALDSTEVDAFCVDPSGPDADSACRTELLAGAKDALAERLASVVPEAVVKISEIGHLLVRLQSEDPGDYDSVLSAFRMDCLSLHFETPDEAAHIERLREAFAGPSPASPSAVIDYTGRLLCLRNPDAWNGLTCAQLEDDRIVTSLESEMTSFIEQLKGLPLTDPAAVPSNALLALQIHPYRDFRTGLPSGAAEYEMRVLDSAVWMDGHDIEDVEVREWEEPFAALAVIKLTRHGMETVCRVSAEHVGEDFVVVADGVVIGQASVPSEPFCSGTIAVWPDRAGGRSARLIEAEALATRLDVPCFPVRLEGLRYGSLWAP